MRGDTGAAQLVHGPCWAAWHGTSGRVRGVVWRPAAMADLIHVCTRMSMRQGRCATHVMQRMQHISVHMVSEMLCVPALILHQCLSVG